MILREDADLLVVNKPPGWNTHAPSPYAGEGLYEWLRNQRPQWSTLAIVHRLDKETSGVLVFAKSKLACQALTQQFTARSIRKRYRFITDCPWPQATLTVRSALTRCGDRYRSIAGSGAAVLAETEFRFIQQTPLGSLVEAVPLTGRTHQIRVHAAESGFPVLGDARYGGSPHPRVCLHAAQIEFTHPQDSLPVALECEPDFVTPPSEAVRRALFSVSEPTTAYRWLHGAADGCAGYYVDRLGDYCLISTDRGSADPELSGLVAQLKAAGTTRGVYGRRLLPRPGSEPIEARHPQWITGDVAPEPFLIRENGLEFEMSFQQGYSVGLFLDQRENRRRILKNYVAPDFPVYAGSVHGAEALNLFSYTCSFSVCAARLGARVTSVDLSARALEWGQRSFTHNQLDPEPHAFIRGDVFDWLKRFARKPTRFDFVCVDPPTFSRSKASGVFRAEKDYPDLIRRALAVLRRPGTLFLASNAADWRPEAFVDMAHETLRAAGAKVAKEQFVPQPPDFPMTREEPGYLKTLWLRVDY